MTSYTGSVRGGFWEFEKSQWNWVPASKEDGWLSELAVALEKMEKAGVSLALCRKTFKLKGNKKFRTWIKKS